MLSRKHVGERSRVSSSSFLRRQHHRCLHGGMLPLASPTSALLPPTRAPLLKTSRSQQHLTNGRDPNNLDDRIWDDRIGENSNTFFALTDIVQSSSLRHPSELNFVIGKAVVASAHRKPTIEIKERLVQVTISVSFSMGCVLS